LWRRKLNRNNSARQNRIGKNNQNAVPDRSANIAAYGIRNNSSMIKQPEQQHKNSESEQHDKIGSGVLAQFLSKSSIWNKKQKCAKKVRDGIKIMQCQIEVGYAAMMFVMA